MELLLDNGSDVLLTDDQSYTSLHLSAAWESAPTVNLLTYLLTVNLLLLLGQILIH